MFVQKFFDILKCLLKCDLVFCPHVHQDLFNGINQGIKIQIGRKWQPEILDKAPQDFDEVEFRRVCRQKVEEQSFFLPSWQLFLERLRFMDRGIINHNHSFLGDGIAKSIKASKHPITMSVSTLPSTQKGIRSLSVLKNPRTLRRLPFEAGISMVCPTGCQA